MNKPLIRIIYYESISKYIRPIINKKSPNKCFTIENIYEIPYTNFHMYKNNIKKNILKL